VLPSVLAAHASAAADPAAPGRTADREARLRSIVTEHYAFLWRLLRRLGVQESDTDDAAQRCLWTVARRLDDVLPGKERPFLFAVAFRVAKDARRPATAWEVRNDELLAEIPSAGPDAGEQIDERRARAMLDALLDAMPLDLRTVFVLYEIEEFTMAEIAGALGIPPGTVASRLRKARAVFEGASRRLQHQLRRKEGRR
jgi:RNA polymerase sigma-70 factor (ECF subfamily)